MSGAFDEKSGIQWVSNHARENAYARYHPPTDLILLARWGELVTCIDLNDRPHREQTYVRNQASD